MVDVEVDVWVVRLERHVVTAPNIDSAQTRVVDMLRNERDVHEVELHTARVIDHTGNPLTLTSCDDPLYCPICSRTLGPLGEPESCATPT